MAALTKFKDHESSKQYLSSLETMHKVVLKANETQIQELTDSFLKNDIDFYLWKEMPENIASAVAARPYEKKIIAPLVRHLKLYD